MLLSESQIRPIVERAIAEDVAWGDITTASLVPARQLARGIFLAKQEGVLAGLAVAAMAFQVVDPKVEFEPLVADGQPLAAGTQIAMVKGFASSILTAERVALNFLQRLSGVATLTAQFVAAIEGTGASIVDTRKTTPGLRLLEKYAVTVGGGRNHRYNLADGILIKDNHLAAAQLAGLDLKGAIARARRQAPHTMRIEVEVESIAAAQEAAEAGADVILLDNMPPAEMARVVELLGNRVILEASGGVNLRTVRQIAETGVHLISVGALTHSAPTLDISLDFLLEP